MFKFGTERFLMNQGGDGGAGSGSAGGQGQAGGSGSGDGGTGGSGAGGSAGASGGSAGTTDWTSTLNDDLKGFVQTKGFKDPGAVLDSYKNLEKLMGAPRERLMTIPDKDDDKAGWDNIYSRLGRPADANGYDIKLDDNAATPEFKDFIKSTMHELGITKKQGEALMGKYGEFFKGQVEKMNQTNAQTTESQVASLKKEWGAAHDQNIQTAKSAAVAFKLDAAKIDALEAALGYDGVMKFLNEIGSRMGTHQFIDGGKGGGGGALTPAAAKAKINELKNDSAFTHKFLSGDMSAKTEMENLHKWAYPSES